MTFADYLVLVAGMGLVTYLPRTLPLVYLAHRELPQWFVDWLSLIPVAILSALLAPILFADPETRSLSMGNLELIVAIPTLLFAIKTRSLGGTVLAGMGLYWGAGMFF
jgi:branched-subunit amino acid transport protein